LGCRFIDGQCRLSIGKGLERIARLSISQLQYDAQITMFQGRVAMSRQLMFSAMLSIAMMAAFALNSQAYAGDERVRDFAQCDPDKLETKAPTIEYSVPARLVLGSL